MADAIPTAVVRPTGSASPVADGPETGRASSPLARLTAMSTPPLESGLRSSRHPHRVLDHQREHRAALRPQPVRAVRRPVDSLIGVQAGELAGDAEEALAFEADDVDHVRRRVLVDRAVRAEAEQCEDQLGAVEQHFGVYAMAARPR